MHQEGKCEVKFLGSSGQKVQIWAENLGLLGQIGPCLRMYKYLMKEVFLVKYSTLYGYLNGSIQFLNFKKFTWFLGWAKV